jgi:hypothetical protein
MRPPERPSGTSLLRFSPLPQYSDALIYGAFAAGAVLLAMAFWFAVVPAWSALRPMADIAAPKTPHVVQMMARP